MSSVQDLVEKQAREIEELKRERNELRRTNALLERSPAIAKLQEQLETAQFEAREELRLKDAELANRKEHHIRDVEKLKADLKRETEIKDVYGRRQLEASSAAMRIRDEATQEARVLRQQLASAEYQLREALQRAAHFESHAAKLNEQLSMSEKGRATLHHIASTQAADFDQRAYRFNGQFAAAAIETASLKTQIATMHQENSELRAKITSQKALLDNLGGDRSKRHTVVEKAKSGLEVIRKELLRIREEHSKTLGNMESQHGKEIDEIKRKLQHAQAKLNLVRETRLRTPGKDEADARKRSLEPSAEYTSTGRRVKSKTDERPHSDQHSSVSESSSTS